MDPAAFQCQLLAWPHRLSTMKVDHLGLMVLTLIIRLEVDVQVLLYLVLQLVLRLAALRTSCRLHQKFIEFLLLIQCMQS